MLRAMTMLLLFQLAGEIIARSLTLPIPGPVIGMLLLLVTLLIRGAPSQSLRETSQGLLGYLPLLFVPAGVGVMTYAALLQSEWLALLVILVGSTLLTLLVTALAMRLFLALARS